MNRTRIDAMDHLDTHAAVDRLLDGTAGVCTVCDDLVCLDCAAHVAHVRCTRACPGCTAPDTPAVEWDQAFETSSIITELRGLDRVDAAIRAL